ncbi:MAG: PTS sugar transporter subunit IIA [Planctomycetota bacterium]|nr:PTS sugar transporter subunit IIA [Planctomycetota bacterium]
MVKLSELVPQSSIITPVSGSTRDEVIGQLLDSLVESGIAQKSVRDELYGKIMERERLSTTGFGKGVAVPHVKHHSITKMGAAIGLAPRGVDFASLDRQPVFSVVLLLSPADRPDDHLQAMEAIFKSLSKDTFRRFLRQAASVQEVRDLLLEADAHTLGG